MSDTYLIPQFIIEYLEKSRSSKSPQKLISKRLKKFKTPEIETWFKENEVTASYIWNFFVSQGKNEFYYKTCEVCGKRIGLDTLVKHPEAKHCSLKCANSSTEVREKMKQTFLERYGVEHPLQSKEVQEKWKQTILKRFGVEHPLQSKEFQEKRKQTILKRFGVENPLQSKEVQEKMKQTFLERYGVEHPLQSKEVKQTRRSNHWETFCSLLKEKGIIPLFTKEEYINDTGRKFKCLTCGKEFESEGTYNYLKEHLNKDGSYSTLIPYNIFCPQCYKTPYSKGEKEVVAFVQSIYSGLIEENLKGLFTSNPQMELDIYLPELNLGIEFDGDYWHSLEEVQERDSLKDSLCEQKGITLLRIKESEWYENREFVESQIRTFLTTQ